MAPVFKNDKYGFIDEAGNFVIPMIYDAVLVTGYDYGPRRNIYTPCFDDGLAVVTKGGKVAVPFEYSWVDGSYFDEEGFIRVEKNNHWGFVDKSGKVVVPIQV
jgi:hypothetical protein